MPVVALALFVAFAILGFGWRSWEQRRRTRSTGFRGVSGELGSTQWFAGVGFVVALLTAVIAPAYRAYLATVGRFVPGVGLHHL